MRHEPYRARKITKNTYVVDIGAVCYPYLLLGDYLLQAFVKAAERGVDVRIIMHTWIPLPIFR